MSNVKGVYQATKKDGSIYYRSSITFRNKHISLGSFESMTQAHLVYKEAEHILYTEEETIDSCAGKNYVIDFKKRVTLINFRDNNIYFKTPIYLRNKYFTYHLSPTEVLKFDIDDLFFYSTRNIMKRQNHLFVADYGMQINLPNRYGIKNYSVLGKDYFFKNGDPYDYRSENVVVVNQYNGIIKDSYKKKDCFTARLHINGNVVIGHYDTETQAAIAYNKGVDIAREYGLERNYQKNYIEEYSSEEYKKAYEAIKIANSFYKYLNGQ